MEKRMITTDVTEEDFPLEGNLRPQTLEEYIGQEKTKKSTENLYRSSKTAKGCAGSRAFFTALPDWEKQLCPESLQMRWECI